jgi:hypothetical protein
MITAAMQKLLDYFRPKAPAAKPTEEVKFTPAKKQVRSAKPAAKQPAKKVAAKKVARKVVKK